MRILVPVDGSDCSERALRYAIDLVRAMGGSLHVVHFTDVETEATEMIIEQAETVLDSAGIEDEPSVSLDVEIGFRSSNRIGGDIASMVEDEGYDHVVMGHHGAGAVDRLILGSAAETVIRSCAVPVTVVP